MGVQRQYTPTASKKFNFGRYGVSNCVTYDIASPIIQVKTNILNVTLNFNFNIIYN